MIFLWYMTLAGSVMMLFYWLVGRAAGERFLPGQRYLLLMACIFYFMIPLFPFKGEWLNLAGKMEWFSRRREQRILHTVAYMDYCMITNPDGVTYPNYVLSIQIALLACCLLASFIIMVVRIRRYMGLRRAVQKQIAWNQQETAEISKEADRLKKEYRIRRKVEVCILPDAMHSTIGLRHPVIILGGVEENADDMELILRHELLHIRRCDFLARALAEFVKTLHWFNPLAYLLARELADVMEYACDDRLMAGADTEKRKQYATLLAVQMEGVAGTKWSLALARRKSLKRKRVERIMKERKQSRIVTAAVGILVGLGVCVNSMQALAYEDIIRRDSLSSGFQDFWIDGRTGFFVPAAMVEEEAAYWLGPELLYEEQFVDEEGNIWQVMEQPRQTYASCSHSYADGTYTEHEAHADGSCTVYRYSARRCAKCGNVTGKALSNTIDYNPCIHKLYK